MNFDCNAGKDKSLIVVRRSKPVLKISAPDDEELRERVIDFTKVKKGGVAIDRAAFVPITSWYVGQERKSVAGTYISNKTEASHSGLVRSLGKRVGGNPSEVQILPPPQHNERSEYMLRCVFEKIRTFFDENPDCEL